MNESIAVSFAVLSQIHLYLEEERVGKRESEQDHPGKWIPLMEVGSERQSYERHGWRGGTHKKIYKLLIVYTIFEKNAIFLKSSSSESTSMQYFCKHNVSHTCDCWQLLKQLSKRFESTSVLVATRMR